MERVQCSRCRKRIEWDAWICPYCHTDTKYADNQNYGYPSSSSSQKPKKDHLAGEIMVMLIIIVICMIIKSSLHS